MICWNNKHESADKFVEAVVNGSAVVCHPNNEKMIRHVFGHDVDIRTTEFIPKDTLYAVDFSQFRQSLLTTPCAMGQFSRKWIAR